jgi:hypothetical protein
MSITITTIETDNIDIPDRETLPDEMKYNEVRMYIYTVNSRMLCCIKSDGMYYCSYDQAERWDDVLWWINQNLGE